MKYFSPLGKKIGLHYNDMTLLKNTFCRDLKSSMLVDLLIWEGKSCEIPHAEQEQQVTKERWVEKAFPRDKSPDLLSNTMLSTMELYTHSNILQVG